MSAIQVYRITLATTAAAALNGRGGIDAPGRWHQAGQRVIYASQTRALAMLELAAQTHQLLTLDASLRPFHLWTIEVPRRCRIERIETLPRRRSECIRLGSEWLRRGSAAVLEVPSAIAPGEFNYLFNPLHADFGGIAAVASVSLAAALGRTVS